MVPCSKTIRNFKTATAERETKCQDLLSTGSYTSMEPAPVTCQKNMHNQPYAPKVTVGEIVKALQI